MKLRRALCHRILFVLKDPSRPCRWLGEELVAVWVTLWGSLHNRPAQWARATRAAGNGATERGRDASLSEMGSREASGKPGRLGFWSLLPSPAPPPPGPAQPRPFHRQVCGTCVKD